MTDTTATPALDVNAEIDRMVQQSGGLHTAIGPARNSTPDLRVSIDGDGTVTTTVIAPAAHAPEPYLAPGIDLVGQIEGIDRTLARMNDELAEVVGHDQQGKPLHRYDGEDRVRRERSRDALVQTRAVQVETNKVIQANRDAVEQAAQKAQQEKLIELAYTQGDPIKAQALKDALEEVEVKRVAELIVKARRG